MKDDDKVARCEECNQALIDIDNRGERLTGWITCNLWTSADGKQWTRLSEEDLRSLHLLIHGGEGESGVAR
jgi:hypothetical protein